VSVEHSPDEAEDGNRGSAGNENRSGNRNRNETDGGRARTVLLFAPLLLPWTVYVVGGEVALIFPWGLVDPSPLHVTDLYSYLFLYTRGLPDYLLAWPLSVGLYLAALASAAFGRIASPVDARVTPVVLALAGFAHLSVARGLAFQPGRAAYPVGTAVLWAVALALFWTGDGRGN
jgi:uncharacterized protein (TIGR04206 family)